MDRKIPKLGDQGTDLIPDSSDADAALLKFKVLVENSLDIVSILSKDNVVLYQSPACKKILGYTPEELIGRKTTELIHPDDFSNMKAEQDSNRGTSGEIYYWEFRFRHKNGNWVYLDAVGLNMLDDPIIKGRVYHVRDVTQRRMTEEQARKSSKIFQTAFSANHNICTISDPLTGKFIDVNDAWVSATGWSRDEGIGRTAIELNIWGSEENRNSIIDKMRVTGSLRKFQTKMYTRSGEELDIVLTAEIVEITNEDRLFFSAVDVTEQLRTEEELRKSEIRFRRLFNTAEISIWDQDFSEAIVELEKLRSHGIVNFKSYLNENSEEARRLTECVKINSVNDATLVLYGVASREDFVENLAGMMTESTAFVFIGLLEALWNYDDYYSAEVSHKTVDGRDISVIVSLPIPKKEANFTNVPVCVLDITERKRLEENFRRSQKLEAVGQLTGGIAHDFNNILGIVMGNLEILEVLSKGNDQALERIQKALKGVNRGSEITRKLLGFSRKDTHQVSLTSLNKFIENLEDLIAKSLTASIKVKTRLSSDLWSVAVNPGDLEDAILNLSLNGKDAMPDGGILIIETANKVLENDYVRRNPEGKVGEYVMISVSDTGIGMTNEIKEKVLEPFFTTKETGKGTGLGLSMAYGFVQRSGGHLKIYSEVGEGTTVRLYLPRATEQSSNQAVEEQPKAELLFGDEHILIVDDEAELRDVATAHLNTLGYTTVAACDGRQALEILSTASNVDLLFSDVIMPGGMDGYQLAMAVRERYPMIKTLLTSGFTNQREQLSSSDNEFLFRINRDLLNKPYNLSELSFAVRSILDS